MIEIHHERPVWKLIARRIFQHYAHRRDVASSLRVPCCGVAGNILNRNAMELRSNLHSNDLREWILRGEEHGSALATAQIDECRRPQQGLWHLRHDPVKDGWTNAVVRGVPCVAAAAGLEVHAPDKPARVHAVSAGGTPAH